MLDNSITGVKPIDSRAVEALSRLDISPRYRVFIYRNYAGKEYAEELFNVVGYTSSEDKQFGASSLELEATNEDGMYSYKNQASVYNNLYIYEKETRHPNYSDGQLKNVKSTVIGDLTIVNPLSRGEWVSDVLEPKSGALRWTKIKWDINLPYAEDSDGKMYHSSVNMFYRNHIDGKWGNWVKFQYASSGQPNPSKEKTVLIPSGKLQIRLDLFAGNKDSIPLVKDIGIEEDILKGDTPIIENQPLYYYGNRIEVCEYITSLDGTFEDEYSVFNGFLDEVVPSENYSGSFLSCTALDFMQMCLNGYIEKPKQGDSADSLFHPRLLGAYTVDLPADLPVDFGFFRGDLRAAVQILEVVHPADDPEGIPMTEDDVNCVFRLPDLGYRDNGPIRGYEHFPEEDNPKKDTRGDRKYLPWVQRPKPVVFVDRKPVGGGYQIDYERGVVYFGEKQEDKDGQPLEVSVSFFWYDLDTNLYEDVVGEILADAIQQFGFERPKRIEPRDTDYDIWRAESHDIEIVLERSNPRTTIPPLTFTIDDGKTFFEALEEVNKYISADYYLRATPEGRFVGEYLPQKPVRDYNLSLITELSTPVSSDDVYTRCVAMGVSPSVSNIAIDNKATKISWGAKTPDYHKPGSDSVQEDIPPTRLIDGDLTTNVGWLWVKGQDGVSEAPSLPQVMIRCEFVEPVKLGAINLLCGDGVGQLRSGSGNKYGPVSVSGMGYRIEVSRDDVLWYTVTDNDLEGSSGEWLSIDKESMLDDVVGVEWKYLRVQATRAPYSERGADGVFFGLFGRKYQEVWNWAIREFQIFPDETIRVEVTVDDLVSDPLVQMPPQVAEDLKMRIGTKTARLPIDANLRSADAVRARALDYLYNCCRNLYTSSAQVAYMPYCRVGHTVGLYSVSLFDGTESYHVNAVRRGADGGIPSVTVDLIQWG